jgi:hypothetical protein
MVQFALHTVAEAQVSRFGQALLVGAQAWVLSHALVVKVKPEQASVAQDVLVAVYRHAPLPSHFPSNPQGGFAVHVL